MFQLVKEMIKIESSGHVNKYLELLGESDDHDDSKKGYGNLLISKITTK